MRHALGRWSLVALAVAVTVGAGYLFLTFERQTHEIRGAFATTEGQASSLHASLAEARRALAAMASRGQAAEGWSRQAKGALGSSTAALASLASAIPGAAVDASRDALGKLAEAEDRIRDHAVGGRPLLASDVAFGEALPLLEGIDGRVAEAIRQEASAVNTRVAALRDGQAAAVAGALAALLLAVLILAPVPRTGVDATVGALPDASPAAQEAAALTIIQGEPSPPPPSGEPTGFDVQSLASACSQLSAMVDGSQLSVVLEGVAHALGASGVIVWLTDAEGTSLEVVAFHGYDPRLIARLGAIGADDDNPTSRAFRTARAVTAPPGAGQPAATAVPIAGAKGVVGVLAAEMGTSAAGDLARSTAAAAIVAAQLATLLVAAAPADAGLSGSAQAL